jgi:hypothetical protein
MTKKTALLLVVLVTLACGAVLAATPQPAAPQSPAMAAILAGASGPPAGAQYVTRCVPTINVCVNQACQCGVTCGSRGVKLFICNQSCVCN